jgi:sulfur-oxidizing protein SoxY
MTVFDRAPFGAPGRQAAAAFAIADLNRRSFIQRSSAVTALMGCGLIPRHAGALPDDEIFRLTRMGDVLERLGGMPVDHDEITLTVPDLAENGANVRVSVESSLTGVQEIYVLAESNPFPFAVGFSIPVGTDASVGVNLKLAQSGDVIGVVRAQNKLYWRSQRTQVTVGGCA